MPNIDISKISFTPKEGLQRTIRVLIMIPIYGGMKSGSLQSLLALNNFLLNHPYIDHQILIESGNAMITHARNKLCGGNLANGQNQKPHDNFDKLFFIDADVIYTPEQFIEILQTPGDIVSGIYFGKNEQKLPVVYHWDEGFFKEHLSMPTFHPDELDGSIKEAGYVGMGFCCIDRRVLEIVKYPWFGCREFTIGSMTDLNSEDTTFCLKAREAGFKILAHTGVWLGHEGSKIYSREK